MSECEVCSWTEAERLEALRIWSELRDMGRDDDFPQTVLGALALLHGFWASRKRLGVEGGP